MNLAESLGSDNAKARGAAWVELCDRAFGVRRIGSKKLGRSYRLMSESLNSQNSSRGSTALQMDGPIELATWALVYGFKTFELLRRLLPGRCEGRWTELGAGLGPGAILCGLRGAEARAVELSQTHCSAGDRLARAADSPVAWYPRDFREQGPTGNFIVPFALKEAFHDERPRKIAGFLRQLSRNGQVWVIEAGTKSHSGWLREVRNELSERIVSPCTGIGSCPLAEDDWCHFRWMMDLPDFMADVADEAGRDPSEFSFSYIRLGGSRQEGRRVLSSRLSGKGKWRLDLCPQNGPATANALLRGDFGQVVQKIRSHDLVGWDDSGAEMKGDGLRLTKECNLRVLGENALAE